MSGPITEWEKSKKDVLARAGKLAAADELVSMVREFDPYFHDTTDEGPRNDWASILAKCDEFDEGKRSEDRIECGGGDP